MKSASVDLLNGKITRALVIFAIPMFFSQLCQTLYNTVDTVLIGYFLGDASLAALGSTTAIFDLIVGFCVGCGNGFGIIVGQRFGAGDPRGLKKAVAQSIWLSLAIGLVFTLAAWLGLPLLLQALQTPAEIFDPALSYIRIICTGLLITVAYNGCAGLLRAIGDSLTPLIVLAISCLINVGLDCLFIVPFHMGVDGAAWATLAAQLISTVVCLVWIVKKKPLLVPEEKDYRLDIPLCRELMAQGLAMGFMSSIVSIGSVILQGAINALGTLLIAAHTAARKVYMMLGMPMFALMSALVAFVAQNMGAGQYQRVIEGVRASNRLCVIYCIVLTIIIWPSAGWLIEILSGSSTPEVLENGALYLRVNIPFFFALGILCNLRSTLQGLGRKVVPVISSVIELIGKLIFTWMIIPAFGYTGVAWCEPIIWCFMMFYLAIMYLRLPLFWERDLKPKIL